MNEGALRAELTQWSIWLVRAGVVVGPGGNVSARLNDTVLISPSGLSLDQITPDDWVAVDFATGGWQATGHRPSSELSMHLAIYAGHPAVTVVVHAHPPHTVAVSAVLPEVPPMFPDAVALLKQDRIRVIDYVIPCGAEIAAAVSEALTGQTAVILGNHGAVTIGRSLREACYRTQVLEENCRIFWMARALGTPRVLGAGEAAALLDLEAERYRQRLLEE